jgi:hemolysin activation/secretion protein
MFLRCLIAVLGLACSLNSTAQTAPAPQPAAPASAASAPAGPRFDLLEFEVVGNSVLPDTVVEQAVSPFLGENKTMADLEGARTALERAYQDAGYLTVLVDIPEQRISEGVVQLRVTEGRVDRLRVTGSRYYSQGFIRAQVGELAPGKVPDFNTMQRQLATVNREQRQVQPLLRPGLTPGTVEAELRVADQLPVGASVDLNNRHAAGTAALRSTSTLRYDNLFQADHSLSATFITAPEDVKSSRVLSLGYSAPLVGPHSLGLSLVLSDSRSEPLGAATVLGKGLTLGLRWLRSDSVGDGLHTLSAGVDYKTFRERVEAGSDVLSTPLRYLPLSLGYNGSWFGPQVQASLGSTLVVGLRSVLPRSVDCPGNIGPVDQFACKRQNSDGSFALLKLDASTTWRQFTLRVAGQLTSDLLPSSELYSAGGATTVRGYFENEASGDTAWLAGLEWRSGNLWPKPAASANTPAVAPAATPAWWGLQSLTALAFAEAARVRTLEPAAGQAARVPLAGAGVGLRLKAQRHLDAELDLAWPLKRTAASPDTREPRLHVRVAAQF